MCNGLSMDFVVELLDVIVVEVEYFDVFIVLMFVDYFDLVFYY